MKINRAFGLLMFLFVAQFMFADIFASFTAASSAVLRALEAAALRAQSSL